MEDDGNCGGKLLGPVPGTANTAEAQEWPAYNKRSQDKALRAVQPGTEGIPSNPPPHWIVGLAAPGRALHRAHCPSIGSILLPVWKAGVTVPRC